MKIEHADVVAAIDTNLTKLGGGNLHISQRGQVVGLATEIIVLFSGGKMPPSADPAQTGGVGKKYLNPENARKEHAEQEAAAAASFSQVDRVKAKTEVVAPLFDGLRLADADAEEAYTDSGLEPLHFAGIPPSGADLGYTAEDVNTVAANVVDAKNAAREQEEANVSLRDELAKAKGEIARLEDNRAPAEEKPDVDAKSPLTFASEAAASLFAESELVESDFEGLAPKGSNGYTVGELKELLAAAGK